MSAVIRILTGLLLCVSGAEKLIWPYQNFLYVVQGYQFIPSGLDVIVARVFPWIEFLAGLLLVLGLWVPHLLRVALVMFSCFILLIAQALLRKLPIEECGCFGQLISMKPQHTLVMDSLFFLGIAWALRHAKDAGRFSLDRYFAR